MCRRLRGWDCSSSASRPGVAVDGIVGVRNWPVGLGGAATKVVVALGGADGIGNPFACAIAETESIDTAMNERIGFRIFSMGLP
jgi:hypothetical protein